MSMTWIIAVLSALITLAGSPPEAAAQRILSSEGLLTEARNAGRSEDWVGAFGYLMAYVQRDPAEMAVPDYRRRILEALNAAGYNARAARAGGRGGAGVGGKGDAPAGVSARGDSRQRGGGSAGNTMRFDIPVAPDHPRTYRMECRGGGDMTANYYPRGETVELEIYFSKARSAAEDRRPGPGECAWMDRPVGPGEPARLRWRFSRSEQGIERIMLGSNAGRAAGALPANRGDRVLGLVMEVDGGRLKALIEAIDRGRAFAVACYNDGAGSFVVTSMLGANPAHFGLIRPR
jgi:hypothetical protein